MASQRRHRFGFFGAAFRDTSSKTSAQAHCFRRHLCRCRRFVCQTRCRSFITIVFVLSPLNMHRIRIRFSRQNIQKIKNHADNANNY